MKFVSILMLCFTLSPTFAQTSQNQPKFTRAVLKRMIHEARTSEQFQQLASYYKQQAQTSQLEAQQYQIELARLREMKYHPRSFCVQVEAAQNHIRIDQDHAKLFSERASLYLQRAQAISIQPVAAAHGVQAP